MSRVEKPLKPQRPASPGIALSPAEIEQRYRISNTSRQRWERTGKLPKRDFHVGGKPVGWLLETIMRAERGETVAA